MEVMLGLHEGQSIKHTDYKVFDLRIRKVIVILETDPENLSEVVVSLLHDHS